MDSASASTTYTQIGSASSARARSGGGGGDGGGDDDGESTRSQLFAGSSVASVVATSAEGVWAWTKLDDAMVPSTYSCTP